MKTTDLFKTSAKKLNESLAKTFGEKLNLESFDTPKLEDARNKLRTQISQVRNESGFNETIENEALTKAQWMLDSINAEIAERAEHIVADPVNEDAGNNYAEQLAQEVFDKNPKLDASGKADEVLNAVWPLMVRDLGKKAAFGKLNYDEDFPSDFVSAYAHLQKQEEDDYYSLPMPNGDRDESVEMEAGRFGGRDAYQRDYDSSRTGFGKNSRAYQADGGANDEGGPEYNPEFERNKQETYSYNVKVNGEVVNDKPFFGRSAALAWAKEQVAAGTLDPKSAVLSPVHGGNEAYDMDQVRKDAEASVKKSIDKQSDDRIAKLKQGGDKGEPFMAQVGRKIIGGVKGAARGFAGKESIETNESIEQTGDDMRNLNEGEIQQASAIVTAKTMVDRVGRWIEELSGMENDTLLTLGDSIRDEMGQEAAKNFISACAPAIQQALQNLKDTREALSTSVRALTGEEQPAEMLGAEAPDMGADMGSGLDGEEMPAEPDAMNAGDDFGAADAAAGGDEEMGRMKRESIDRSSRLLKVLAG